MIVSVILSIFSQTMLWVWLGIMIVAIVFEAATPSNLVSIWFAIGALVALVISIIFPNLIWLQVVCFFVVSGSLLLCTRKLAKKLQDTPDVKTNVDGLIGKEGKVTIEILPHEIGEVKVEGKLWSAISDCKIEKNSYIEVLGVDGVKLLVKEIENDK